VIPVVLASRSPRRTELLSLIGVPHRVAPSGVPEDAQPGESPRDQVLRLACDKAEAVLSGETGDALVIGADTLVVLDGLTLGQPRDASEAAAMLRRLSGRTHTVLTGVCLARRERPRARGVSESRVTFHAMSEGEIQAYVAGGEPMDKAGAYAAQGLGAVFLASIEGSFHNVVGFPLDLFYRLLPGVGLSLPDLRGGA
jgi:septum formation protein